MAYAFNEDKSKVEVLPASNTYAKNEVYTKSETSSVLASYVTRATADATYVPQTSSDLVPAGAITQFAGAPAPAGWLLCNGQSVSKNDYSALFSVIGYTYGGSGDTFNLPDLRDKFPIGKNADALGSTGGSSTKTLTIANLPAHTHGSKSITGYVGQVIVPSSDMDKQNGALSFIRLDDVDYASSGSKNDCYRRVINFSSTHEHESVGSSQAFDSMPPYITLNYIIKY